MSVSLIYSEAKKALNASAPDRVVGREKENDELEKYLLDCFNTKKAMSLYVNGQPGTGKTLSVTSLLEDLKVYNINKIQQRLFKLNNSYFFNNIEKLQV